MVSPFNCMWTLSCSDFLAFMNSDPRNSLVHGSWEHTHEFLQGVQL